MKRARNLGVEFIKLLAKSTRERQSYRKECQTTLTKKKSSCFLTLTFKMCCLPSSRRREISVENL